jgi:hypothetical protein
MLKKLFFRFISRLYRMNYANICVRKSTYKDGGAQEDDEEVVVVDADAVEGHAAVVVVPDAAPVAHRAVVHPRQLVDLAL